jgi:glycosyltransferase involved in cell wall biosynthesis
MVPNLRYLGPFSGFDAIPAAPYRAFLYTSAWDGLPNILLEAMAAGLLVVAPAVGGIPEIVNEATGLLVRECNDPAAYVAAIETTRSQPDHCAGLAETGRAEVARSFTREGFNRLLRELRA